MITHISHITIFVHDQSEALAFYQKLGFEVHTDVPMPGGDTWEAGRWLTICLPSQKNVEVALLRATTEQQKKLVGMQADSVPLLSFATDNCDEEYKRLRAQGITSVSEPQREPWGTSMTLRDLYGNMLYICKEGA